VLLYKGVVWALQLFPAFFLDYLTIDDGMDRLSRNVGNNQTTLRNIPEERRPQICFRL